MKIFVLLYKFFKVGYWKISSCFCTIYARILLLCNGVFVLNLTSNGLPWFNVSLGGVCEIGENLVLNNGAKHSSTSDNRPCKIIVGKKGYLSIGRNVGLTGATICAQQKIIIKDNVKIGGGSMIFDTNFHMLNPEERLQPGEENRAATAPVIIGYNVFIGAAVIITKGVEVGDNAIIGAGSVVTRSIPANEIWGGNPARFIRTVC